MFRRRAQEKKLLRLARLLVELDDVARERKRVAPRRAVPTMLNGREPPLPRPLGTCPGL